MNDQCNITLPISKDSTTEGLDLQASQTWIYPTNYPIREYQYNIIEKALLNNTLVSLPTGLGKTFIAAVVMYNYFRWFPFGKVIFMAPTRPLVKQQVDACYDIMGIPMEATAELTGTKASTSREEIWENKRVFFITPQILQNDLDRIPSLGNKIKCLVFDEAHKAKGNHSYCEVIRKLQPNNKYFRVLALSATPGGSVNDVLEVIRNLLISHLEFRTEESKDVIQYVFKRNLTTIVVPLGMTLQKTKDDYLKILDYYTRILIRYKVIQGNCANLTKGKIFSTLNNFKQNCRSAPNFSEIMKNLTICMTLYHGFELLVRHGLRSFAKFFEDHIDNPFFRENHQLIEIVKSINSYLGPKLKLEPLPDGSFSAISKDVKFGHPKFYKLKEILENHFQEKSKSSRAIVFFEYRESVMEAYALLHQSAPLLKPRMFLGQKNGITQTLQLNVIKAFRDGYCNILLSTCIGEEGLDVGDVDLIICFDISNKSPIRMVQRMGRTGRKKDGSIIVLVTEGQEQQALKDCLIHKNNVTYHVLQSSEIAKGLYSNCPKMLVDGQFPRCEKIFITVKKPVLKKNSSLKDMFRCMSNSNEPNFPPDLELVEIDEKIPKLQMLWPKATFLEDETIDSNLNILNKKITKQRSFQEGHRVKHSKDSEMLVTLLQLADSKRFNIPMTQIGTSSQMVYNKYLKQTDIRQMFMKSQSAGDFDIPSIPVQKTISSSPGTKEKLDLGPEELFTEISSYLSIQSLSHNMCRHCPKSIDCEKFIEIPKPTSYNWFELDCSIFTTITNEDLHSFKKTLNSSGNAEELEFDDSLNFNLIQLPSQKTQTPKVLELDDLIDKSIFADFFDKTARFEEPKSLNNLLNKYSNSVIDVDDLILTSLEPSKQKSNIEQPVKEELLEFFKLSSLNDIFYDSRISSSETVVYSESPDIFGESPVKLSKKSDVDRNIVDMKENSRVNEDSMDTSPILGSLSNRSQRFDKPNLQNLKRNFNNIVSPSKFTMNQTKISSTPLSSQSKIKNINRGMIKSTMNSIINNKKEVESDTKISDLSDLCDLSIFGIESSKPTEKEKIGESPTSISKIACMSDSYNLEDFCQSVEKPLLNDSLADVSCERFEKEELNRGSQNQNKNNIGLADLCDLSLFENICIEPDTSKTNKDSSINLENKSSQAKEDTIVTKHNNHAGKLIYKKSSNSSFDSDKTLDDFIPYLDNKSSSKLNKINNSVSRIDLDETVDNLVPYMMETSNDKPINSFITLRKKNLNNLKSTSSSGKINRSNDIDDFKIPISNVNKISSKPQNTSNYSNMSSRNSEQNYSVHNNSISQLSITQMLSFINKDDSKPLEITPQKEHNLSKTNNSKLTEQTNIENSQKEIYELDEDFVNFTFNSKKSPLMNKLSLNKPRAFNKSNLSESSNTSQINSKKNVQLSTSDFGKSKNTNVSLNKASSSDDDFEPKPTTSPAWIKPKAVMKKLTAKKVLNSHTNKKKTTFKHFIEDEAEVSDNDSVFLSGDEDETALDHFENSFVADETHHIDTQMHAVYLQSIRSPVINKKPLKRNMNINVYSQEVSLRPEEETYLEDSFVVHEEEAESNDELTQLEILEMKLEHRKKRKSESGSKKPTKRRRRIIEDFSDDSG